MTGFNYKSQKHSQNKKYEAHSSKHSIQKVLYCIINNDWPCKQKHQY